MELSKSENVGKVQAAVTVEKKPKVEPEPEDSDEEFDDFLDDAPAEVEEIVKDPVEANDDDDLDELFGEDETEIEDEPVKEYPEDIREQIAKLHRKCPDGDLRLKINEMVAPYKRLKNTPQEKLEEIYDLLTSN